MEIYLNRNKLSDLDATTTPRSLSTKRDGAQSHNSNGTGTMGNGE